MNKLDERLDELEAKIAFLELANQQISDLVYDQQKQIDQHKREFARQIESLQISMEPGDPADEKPPHY